MPRVSGSVCDHPDKKVNSLFPFYLNFECLDLLGSQLEGQVSEPLTSHPTAGGIPVAGQHQLIHGDDVEPGEEIPEGH